MELERELANEKGRVVNLDPGLLGRDALALATHKYGGHRLELAPGIYGEVTLSYLRGAYRPCPGPIPITPANSCAACWAICAAACFGA